jgi:hypothetical protein
MPPSGSIFTKSEYASRLGVRPSAVSNYIARGQLTEPALRRDGRIDANLADQQLDVTLDAVRKAARPIKPALESPSTPPSSAAVIDLDAGRSLRSRATIEGIRAERARREFEHERDRYTLTEAAQAEWR